MSDPDENPLTADTNPTTLNINSKLLLITVKVLIGLILLIVSLCFKDHNTINSYLILIFLGIYLICDAVVSVFPETNLVLKINER